MQVYFEEKERAVSSKFQFKEIEDFFKLRVTVYFTLLGVLIVAAYLI